MEMRKRSEAKTIRPIKRLDRRDSSTSLKAEAKPNKRHKLAERNTKREMAIRNIMTVILILLKVFFVTFPVDSEVLKLFRINCLL